MANQQPQDNTVDNKRMNRENMPFIVIELILLMAYLLRFGDKGIVVPVLFFVIGGQQLFNGLRFCENDPKQKKFYFACGFGSFAAALFLILNDSLLK